MILFLFFLLSHLQTLITEFNELGSDRFHDPRTKKSFKYDYLTGESSEVQPAESEPTAEPWRSALEEVWSTYTADHFYDGISSVFASLNGSDIILSACLEGHQFQPQNYWNGLWRSIWTLRFPQGGSGKAEVVGKIKAQVHYYENGNVQLVSFKDVKETISFTVSSSIGYSFCCSLSNLIL